MHPYPNPDGHSGVVACELGPDWIRVRFASGKDYRYSAAGAGAGHVRTMQILAQAGGGLATYISKFVHDDYDRGP